MRALSPSKYSAPAQWPELLRRHALVPPPAAARAACLHAFRNHNAFYAERLRGVERWEDIAPLEKADLAGLPVATSERIYDMRSSGTTGQQIVVHASQSEGRFRQALSYRPLLFCDLPELVHQVIFRDGDVMDAPDKQQFPFHFGGRTYLTWRVGIAASPELIAALLQAVRPQLVRGLTSGILRFVTAAVQPLQHLGVRVVSTSGEFLSAAWRSTIADAFGAAVLDRYGSTETGSLAWQCAQCGRYHANTDEQLLEPTPAGLLVTPLFMEAQPLLRYRLQDIVRWDDALTNCTVGLPTVTISAARRDDWLIDGRGRKVSPLSFQFEQVPGLRYWRLHQDAAGNLQLFVDGDIEAAAQADMRRQLQRLVVDRPAQIIVGVEHAPLGNKFKRVSSELDAHEA